MKISQRLTLQAILTSLFCGVVLCGSFFYGGFIGTALATDGSGTNTVFPTTATTSTTGNTFTFIYTAGENLDSGGIKITVPAGGWSVPQGNNGVAGYTTATSTGTVADVKNNLDTSTGWAVTNRMTLSADTGDKQEGTASLSNAITSQAVANDQWYFNYGGAADWGESASGNLRVGMWLKSSVATAAGNLHWQDDNSANLGSPSDTISLGGLSANTWTYTSATLGATSRNSILSYGFRYTTDIGAATVKADSLSVIFQANDSNTGWNGDAGISDSLITGAGNFMEGTGAVRCSYNNSAGVGSSGDCRNSEGSVITVGPGTTVSFWVRSSIALNAGDFAWADDNSATLDSPDSIVDLPALAANTWTYVKITSPTSGDMRSFGLRQLVDKGAMTIDIDAIGKQIDTCDSTTGWTAPTSTGQTVSTDNGVFHEGTGSLKNVIVASAVAGDKWYQALGVSENWSAYTTAGFWIRSTVATTAGQLKFEYASSNDLTSPIASINIGALAANTWTYQKLTLTGTRTSVLSYGINYSTDIGAATIYLDDVLLGPGSITFSGNDINARFLSLSAAQTLTTTYGNGGGTSGVTTPATPAVYGFTTSSRISDSGTLTNIGTSPTVTVSLPATTTTIGSSGSPSVYGDMVTFTATVTPAGGGAPTGDVTFKDGLITIGTGTLNGANPGIATLNISTLTVAGSPHSITAVYGGDSNHSGSTSSATAQSVTPKNLTVTGITASDKIYDSFTTATLNVGSAALVGVVSPDTVTLNTGSAVGTFVDKNVGVGKTVAVSGLTLSGVDASNYSLTQPSTTASITAKNLTVSGITASDKVYDSFAAATLSVGGASLVGIISPDAVTLNTGSAVGTFSDKNVGVGKTVTVSGLSISGADSGNYSLTQPSTTASITAKNLTISGITADDKVYDGNNTATLVGAPGTLVGVIVPDVVTIAGTAVGTFSDPNVGVGKAVTISGLSITGVDSGNYSLIAPTATASITAATLTVTGITANDKVYDSFTTATLNTGSAVLVGIAPGDVVTLNTGSAVGTFFDKNVGTGKTVTVSGLTLGGADAGKYTLIQPTTTASITAKNLTVSGITASDKVYDRLTTATLNTGSAALVGVIAPDAVILSTGSAVGSFSDFNVGVGKTVTISGLSISGADSGNYSLTQPSTTASITAKNLTVSGITASDKVYDGNQAAALNVVSAALVGVIAPDAVILSTGSAVGTFSDPNVGAGKTVTISGLTLSGADAGNYALIQPTTTASITAASLTVSGVTADDKIYDRFTNATLNTASAVLVGVEPGDVVVLETGLVAGTFSDKNVGAGKTVTISGLTLSGADASKYNLIQPTTTASITAKNLTISGITANDKVYDGNNTATLVGAPGALVGVIAPDVVTISGTAVGTFSDPNVGVGKTVTISGLNISGIDSGNYSLTQPTTTASITAAALTVTGITASDKVYDRFTAATLNTTSATLVGVEPGDIVTLNTASAVGTFSDFNVGVGKTVTVSGLTLSGADASKYTLIQPTTTANITAKNLTVFGITANDKVYDGNQAAALNVVSAALVGVISPDAVTLNTGSAVGTFSDPNVGTGKTVTVSGLTISGADSGNYSLSQPTATASITSSGLTVTGITASDKIYNGNQVAVLNTASATLVGVEPGDIVVLETGLAVGTFSDKNVGTGKTIAISGLTLSGADAGEYSLTQPSTTASITAKNLTISGITADDKVYDGNNTATLVGAPGALVGVIAPDVVTIAGTAVGTFSDESIGNDKVVTISGLTIAGADSGNYSLTAPTDTANITSGVIPVVATKLVIVQPSSATVGSNIVVTIRAEDNSGNLDNSFNNVITLISSGSATGAGPISIVNGIGTATMNNSVAESVVLGLLDTVGLGLDTSSTGNASWTTVVVPPVPAGPVSLPPTPIIRARAYPGADILISSFSGSAALESTRVVSSSNGYFDIALKSTGTTSYGVVATDANGDRSQTKVFSFNLDLGGLDTNLSVVIPPTAKLLRSSITKGDNMVVTGYGFGNSAIQLFIDGVRIGDTARTDDTGKYRLLFNTAGLSFGSHEVMVNEVLQDGTVSDYSIRRTITISSLFTPKADFNNDAKINIQDWSIFLSRWNTAGGANGDLDLNGDGMVDIADFSIMLRAVQQ